MKFDKIIFQYSPFCVATIPIPHVSREDGGHIVIASMNSDYHELEDLSYDELSLLMRLTVETGKIMKKTLLGNGVDIGNLNYQVNGNWSVKKEVRDPLHMHIYGRARNAVYQKFGSSLVFPDPASGFYDNFKGLTDVDIKPIALHLEGCSLNGLF